jgi:hypothetical protein
MNLLSFDKMITPSIIKGFFFLGVFINVIIALAFAAAIDKIAGFISALIAAVVFLIAAVLVSRIFAESLLIIFMIRDELAWQRENWQSAISAKSASSPNPTELDISNV